jgi:hypothetical protein
LLLHNKYEIFPSIFLLVSKKSICCFVPKALRFTHYTFYSIIRFATMTKTPSFQSEVQVRLIDGDIQVFNRKSHFRDFFCPNEHLERVEKVSFDGPNGRHRFVKTSIDQDLQQALMQNSNMFFPIGTVVYADIPLDESKFPEAGDFAAQHDIDFYDAYNCICVRNAVEAPRFWMYVMQTA